MFLYDFQSIWLIGFSSTYGSFKLSWMLIVFCRFIYNLDFAVINRFQYGTKSQILNSESIKPCTWIQHWTPCRNLRLGTLVLLRIIYILYFSWKVLFTNNHIAVLHLIICEHSYNKEKIKFIEVLLLKNKVPDGFYFGSNCWRIVAWCPTSLRREKLGLGSGKAIQKASGGHKFFTYKT